MSDVIESRDDDVDVTNRRAVGTFLSCGVCIGHGPPKSLSFRDICHQAMSANTKLTL